MTTQHNGTLSKLNDIGKTVDGAANHIRRRNVKDEDGKDLGKVHELLVDDNEGKVRLLLGEHGGFLGMGKTKSFDGGR